MAVANIEVTSISLTTILDHHTAGFWCAQSSSHQHLGEFPIGSYLKVKDSTKSSVTFLVLVRGKFSLYHLKAYVYSFILSSGF